MAGQWMSDVVLVTLIPQASVTAVVRLRIWIIPAFARRGLQNEDSDILETLRIMLTIKEVLFTTLEVPYKRIKQLEKSGASVFTALPRYTPSFWGHNAQPCVLYTLLAAGRMRVWLGDICTIPQLMCLLWNVIVPERCPRCDDADFWTLESEHRALCYGCNYTVDV